MLYSFIAGHYTSIDRVEQLIKIQRERINLLNTVKIVSFSIQIFGQIKASKPEVMDMLVQIIHRYDIVATHILRSRVDRRDLSTENLARAGQKEHRDYPMIQKSKVPWFRITDQS